jgi:hypothetical protein
MVVNKKKNKRAYNDSHNAQGSVNRPFLSYPRDIVPETEAGDQDKYFQVKGRQEGHEELEI